MSLWLKINKKNASLSLLISVKQVKCVVMKLCWAVATCKQYFNRKLFKKNLQSDTRKQRILILLIYYFLYLAVNEKKKQLLTACMLEYYNMWSTVHIFTNNHMNNSTVKYPCFVIKLSQSQPFYYKDRLEQLNTWKDHLFKQKNVNFPINLRVLCKYCQLENRIALTLSADLIRSQWGAQSPSPSFCVCSLCCPPSLSFTPCVSRLALWHTNLWFWGGGGVALESRHYSYLIKGQ